MRELAKRYVPMCVLAHLLRCVNVKFIVGLYTRSPVFAYTWDHTDACPSIVVTTCILYVCKHVALVSRFL